MDKDNNGLFGDENADKENIDMNPDDISLAQEGDADLPKEFSDEKPVEEPENSASEMQDDDLVDAQSEEAASGREQRINRGGKKRRRSSGNIFDKIFIVLLITGIFLGLTGLGVEYVLVKGPSPTLKEVFVMTMIETRRFGFVANIFLTEDEVAHISARHNTPTELETDPSLITIGATLSETQESLSADGLTDDDGDGIIIADVKRNGYEGYMMIVLDPSRVSVGTPGSFSEDGGQTLGQICKRMGVVAGINAGGYADTNGAGLGGMPSGLTVVSGTYYNTDVWSSNFVGFDYDNILHVGTYSAGDAQSLNIRDGVTFGPAIVVNGEALSTATLASGINPRTAIGQRADGAVLLLTIDGRQVHSMGASYADVAEVMLSFGAVNACNLDGGSSTCMWFDGDYVNSCSSSSGVRQIPTAFVVS